MNKVRVDRILNLYLLYRTKNIMLCQFYLEYRQLARLPYCFLHA